jgi:hypothetical protein
MSPTIFSSRFQSIIYYTAKLFMPKKWQCVLMSDEKSVVIIITNGNY